MLTGKLYLIPSPLGENSIKTLPLNVLEIILFLNEFIVEDLKTARRFIIQTAKTLHNTTRITDFDKIIFHILNEHTDLSAIGDYLTTAKNGSAVGLLSDAGCPALADPGKELILLAHQLDIQVIPLVGPSSILLAIIASGLGGQSFAFNGYLPVKTSDRQSAIKKLEQKAKQLLQPQYFIETPYRNQALLNDLLQTLNNNTLLSIAANLTLENQYIATKKISKWKENIPNIHKIPAVFGIL